MNDSFAGDKLRLHLEVHVAHGSDVDKVTEVLIGVAAAHDKILKSPPPSVILKEFASSSLNFCLLVWSNELWFSELVLSELRYEIVRQFRAHAITIPFPQRDLHIKSQPLERGPDYFSDSIQQILIYRKEKDKINHNIQFNR